MHSIARPIFTACLAASCALFTACESARPPAPDEHATATARPIGMRGEITYFGGKIRAEATISRGRPVPFKDGENGGGEHHGGGHGGGHRHGGGGMGGDMAAPRRSEDDDGSPALHMHASTLPAVTLRLKLENLSQDPLDVQIRDVKSDLGDFAVRPERVLLAPGQSAEVDPMVSQLGVTSDEFPVTVALRLATQNESHDLILRNVVSAPPPPPVAK